MAERAYAGVGEEHQHDKRNRGEISSGELRRSGTCNPTRVDISTSRHLGHERRVHWSGENDLGNLFLSSFLRKDENPLTHRRIYKYNAGQESWTGTTEYSNVSTGEVLKLPEGDRGTVSGRDRRIGILQCLPPTDSK